MPVVPAAPEVLRLRPFRGSTAVRSGLLTPHQLAGASSPGPSRLRAAGTVTYRGVNYGVASFGASTTAGPVRVYALIR